MEMTMTTKAMMMMMMMMMMGRTNIEIGSWV